MVDKRKRLWLTLSGASFLCFSACAFLGAYLAPIENQQLTVSGTNAAQIPTRVEEQTQLLSEDEFKFVWNKSLQGPVDDPIEKPVAPKRVPVVEKPVEKVRIEANLVGTLADEDQELARAWIEINGKRAVYSLGDILENHPGRPSIEKIADGVVVIKVGAQPHTLHIERNPAMFVREREGSSED